MCDRFKLCFLLIFTVLILPINAKAECDYQKLADLNKMASNVQLSFNYDIDESGIPRASIFLSNISKDIYVVDNYGIIYTEFESVSQHSFGSTIKYEIYSRDINCNGEKLIDKYLKLPDYNVYSSHELCRNSSDELCSIWKDASNINYNDFKLKLEKEKRSNSDVLDDELDKSESIIPFFIVILIVIIFGILSIFMIHRKKRSL